MPTDSEDETDGGALKYGEELNQHPDCPPNKAAPCAHLAYRFVYEDVANPSNFLPPAKLAPNRVFPEHLRCESLALSFFITERQAQEFFTNLKRRVKNVYKSIGTHLAHVQLQTKDGLITRLRRDGHFSLFESAGIEWEGRFNPVGPL